MKKTPFALPSDLALALLATPLASFATPPAAQSKHPTPPEVWKDYDPDAGDFKEEIISEETKDGIYYKDSYISAYVNGEEVRVYCKYAVKADAKNAPGLMNVHGWYAFPRLDMGLVNEGWAVLAHDYCGKKEGRAHYTKYPKELVYGNMDQQSANPEGYRPFDPAQITKPSQAPDYLWYAIQRRALSYLLAQKEVDKNRIGAKGYSYGGSLMWNLGMDPRVKAVVTYFGSGWTDFYRDKGLFMYNVPYVQPQKTPGEELLLSAITPEAHAPYITAPTFWLNGSNDHHGGHERGETNFKKFQHGVPFSFAHQARGQHDTWKLGKGAKLWLEKYVLGKDIFWPARPVSEIKLGPDGVPDFAAERFVYFGDQANMPYGNYASAGKTTFLKEQILRCMKFLSVDTTYSIKKETTYVLQPKLTAKMIVVACNTATAYALSDIKKSVGSNMPVVGVIDAGCKAALNYQQMERGTVGVFATVGTVASESSIGVTTIEGTEFISINITINKEYRAKA